MKRKVTMTTSNWHTVKNPQVHVTKFEKHGLDETMILIEGGWVLKFFVLIYCILQHYSCALPIVSVVNCLHCNCFCVYTTLCWCMLSISRDFIIILTWSVWPCNRMTSLQLVVSPCWCASCLFIPNLLHFQMNKHLFCYV